MGEPISADVVVAKVTDAKLSMKTKRSLLAD
jgi:hypothetical protein